MPTRLKLFVLLSIGFASGDLYATEFDPENVSSERLVLDDAEIPCFWNVSIDDVPSRSEIDTAVIVIQGNKRRAGSYHGSMLDAAEMDGRLASTVVIAPQFLIESDVEESYDGDSRLLYWSSGGWKKGYRAKNLDRPSSFEIVDHLIGRLITSPHLRRVVVIGHSAGGQFANRYAALSQIEVDSVDVRYIAANPSTYMYFDDKRFVDGEYKVPVTDAPYNKYKYGVDDFGLYYESQIYSFDENVYANKTNIVLLGTRDVARSSSLDKSESADLQGPNRYERGLLYKEHLDRYFGVHGTSVVEVDDVGHSSRRMFQSAAGRSSIFDEALMSGRADEAQSSSAYK